MLEKWKNIVDKRKCFGALLKDWSKAFDCLSHELLIAKLHAYGFELSAIKLIQSYLSNRKQRTKINATYSSWQEILFGVPQGSILGPLLLNIFLCDLFWIMCQTYFASYGDDNTPYALGDSIDDVIKSLEDDSITLFNWFQDNQMKANNDNYHLITSKRSCMNLKIGNINIENSTCEKLLGVEVDNNLNFIEHLDGIIKKAGRKVSALSRIFLFMDLTKRRLLMNSFFSSQFSYCPLIWMCHSRTVNNKINKLNEDVYR